MIERKNKISISIYLKYQIVKRYVGCAKKTRIQTGLFRGLTKWQKVRTVFLRWIARMNCGTVQVVNRINESIIRHELAKKAGSFLTLPFLLDHWNMNLLLTFFFHRVRIATTLQ